MVKFVKIVIVVRGELDYCCRLGGEDGGDGCEGGVCGWKRRCGVYGLLYWWGVGG